MTPDQTLSPPAPPADVSTGGSPPQTPAVYNPAMSGQLNAFREGEIRLITDVADALNGAGDDGAEDQQRLIQIGDDLREMFYLVAVIGEFNAGKSTFVNALLGDTLLPMGITPTTEQIELVRYSASMNRQPHQKDDSTREWQHPNTGAPGVALVDTPGTGSVFMRHEQTAKSFLHRSDLVIFLLSAKRALAETERLYLELARDYGKKVILVINQVDLLAPTEREEVRRFVEQQVDKLLGMRPLIFPVSAKLALNGREDESGFPALRAHLRGVFSEAPPAKQKLIAQLDTAIRILNKHHEGVRSKSNLIGVDTVRVRDVQRELEQQSLGLNTQLSTARAQVEDVFREMRTRGEAFVRDRFSPRRVLRPLPREQLEREFREQVVGRALTEIDDASRNYVNALVDQSRLYWRSVIDRLNRLRELMENETAGLDESIYAEQREALERAISQAEGELRAVSGGRLVEQMDIVFRQNLSAFTTSGVTAVVSALVAVAIAAPGGVAVVGAGALLFGLAIPVAVFGSYFAVRAYNRATRQALEQLDAGIGRLRAAYDSALDDLTAKERARLTQYGNQILTPFFSRLEVLKEKYAAQNARFDDLNRQLETLRRGIEAVG